jgi:hypothetical protein
MVVEYHFLMNLIVHQCGIKLTGLDSVSPYISSLALHTLETLIYLYMALLLVELTLT